ncbi:hypothetical protein IG626_09485 [Desulfovibrio desulfuricans]|uniref:hypothetical protein n=1 Tax=Desulfovibrio desulfuricans TaxID=876 RepID=UPI001785823E|nr:hypothetical protein [Desulfovibrio desulfuricans]MBD8896233.1 hypothetical protein [Desulfovibrio desulfuricans]
MKDTEGAITAYADWPFHGSEQVDYEVVRSWDGRLYKAGEEPAPPLSEVQAAKRAEINAGFDAALVASLTMPSRDTPPSVVELAIAIADFKADDPAGLTDLQSIHEARRASLLAAVDAATSVDAVQAITVSYAV